MMFNDAVVIFKYKLDVFTKELTLPVGAVFLHVECQGNNPVVWFKILESEKHREKRTFCMIGTGQTYNAQDMVYLKTFTQGAFVWHLLEKVR